MENSEVTYGHLLSECNVCRSVVYLIDIVKCTRVASENITATNRHHIILHYFLLPYWTAATDGAATVT